MRIVAALTMLIRPAAEGGPNVQLFPAGTFAARDGRPASVTGGKLQAWVLGADEAAALVARAQARQTPLVIDYEHQTINAKTNGQPAPAAGWIESLSWVEGGGLFAVVRWTARAAEYIAAGEYRFISPVFTCCPRTGAVLELLGAAITNIPGLDGMEPVQAVDETLDDTKGATMDELLERLRWMLNLPVAATAEEVMAELDKIKAQLQAAQPAATTMDLGKLLADLGDLQAKAAAGTDPARFAPVEALTVLTTANQELRAKVAQLEQDKAAGAVDALVQAALADGRLTKGLEPWAKTLPEAALRQYLEAARPIAALTGMQTGGKAPEGSGASSESGQAALSDSQLTINRLMGLSREDFHTFAAKGGQEG